MMGRHAFRAVLYGALVAAAAALAVAVHVLSGGRLAATMILVVVAGAAASLAAWRSGKAEQQLVGDDDAMAAATSLHHQERYGTGVASVAAKSWPASGGSDCAEAEGCDVAVDGALDRFEPGERLQRLRQIADGVHGLEAVFDLDGRLLWISPSVERLTDHVPRDCLAAADPLALLVHDSDLAYCRRMMTRVAAGEGGEDFEMRLLRGDGGLLWVATHWRRVEGGVGRPDAVRLSAEDVQARKETEFKLLETVAELRRAQALREHYLSRSNDERMRLTALLNVIRLGILFMDRDQRVLYYNRAMLDIWGFAPDENLIGVRDVVLQSRVAHLLVEPEAYFRRIQEVLDERDAGAIGEIRFKDGRLVTDASALVEDGEGRRGIGRVWIYEDITEQRRIADKLVQLAERDPLTNLFNRRRFHLELERVLADAMRRGYEVGLIMFDLDGFKPINDEFGHQAGDEVLVSLSRKVGSVIRRNETFFRLGGDEFAVLVPDIRDDALPELARRIVEGVASLAFVFAGRHARLTASLGIAQFPRHAVDGDTLVAAADQAMYAAKAAGRNRWVLATGCPDAKSAGEAESARMNPPGFSARRGEED